MSDAYEIPTDFDLIGFELDGVHRFMAVGPEWKGTSQPSGNGGRLICEELVRAHPDKFRSVKDAQAWFIWTHFRNMHNKQNTAGQPYPKALG